MKIQCQLCPKECVLSLNQRGDCKIRINLDGKLRTLTYGFPCAIHIDPIEKKPLFHFYPRSRTLSIATVGCNLHCKNCQNWEISQSNPEDIPAYKLSPQEIVDIALKATTPSISYTYTEPVVFYEYTLDTAILAKKHRLKNILVTAGYLNRAPLKKIYEVIDATNIDIKFFNDDMYRKITTGTLKPVLGSTILAKKMGLWVEITHLVIPTLNDNPEECRKLCNWIKEYLGESTPLHFSRFFPHYKLTNLPPTPIETLEEFYKIAKEIGLKYVYIGNVAGHPYENTYCPYDGKLLIKRAIYSVVEYNIIGGRCKFCGKEIEGVWS